MVRASTVVFLVVTLVALVFVAVDANDALTETDYQTFFTAFVKKHHKSYTHDEFFPRYAIFKANYNKIRHHNSGKSTYSMAVNEFADMTFAEFRSTMIGPDDKQRPPRSAVVDQSVLRPKNATRGAHHGDHLLLEQTNLKAPLTGSLDWRTRGVVTPVKNQLVSSGCGSGWAFSATGAMEGAHALATGTLVALSEQQLLDCSAPQGNAGCGGGSMDAAFDYVIAHGGIASEAAYPYTASTGTCHSSPSVASISSYVDVTVGSEVDLKAALSLGPVSAGVEADQQAFQFYSGGILSDNTCGTNVNQGVLVVGFGTDTVSNMQFWIVKNSWGTSWGEAGYARLMYGVDQCGISLYASYPVV